MYGTLNSVKPSIQLGIINNYNDFKDTAWYGFQYTIPLETCEEG